jgi:hypothetical protein
VAALVAAAAKAAGDNISLGYAARMKECADRQNFYLGEDFLDVSTGEVWDGFGNLFGCGLKLCQSCMSRAASRNRTIARAAVQNTKLLKREHFCYDRGEWIKEQERLRFVTLTMPEIFVTMLDTMEIQKRAWDLFRKLKFTKDYFGGFIKSGEFTVRENDTYHAHIHLLAISFFVPEHLIKRYWTDCVEKAFNEFGIEFTARQANVNIKLVDNPDNAIKEVCKYITKTKTWEEIPTHHLLEITRIRRWDRLFEVTGRFRETVRILNAEKERLSSDPRTEGALIEATDDRSDYYLDTDVIIDGEASEADSYSVSSEKPKRENWRQVIEREGLEKYLEILSRQVDYAQKIRKLRLVLKFPDAKFSSLDGKPWDLAEIERFAVELAARGVKVLPA